MNANVLSMVEGPEIAGIFTLIVPCIVFVVYVCVIALVIICLLRVVKYLDASGKEQKLIRMELSKVAEEVHLMRQRLEESAEKKEAEGGEQA